MYKTENFNSKIIDLNKFISLIKPGNKIFLTSGPCIPTLAAKEITTSEKLRNYDLEIIQLFSSGYFFSDESNDNQNYRLKTFRSGETDVEDASGGKKDYIPANLVEIPYIFATKAIEIDIAVVTTSPPDKRGYMSLGVAIDVADTVINHASLVITEVNPNMPVTYGETSIHVDQWFTRSSHLYLHLQ